MTVGRHVRPIGLAILSFAALLCTAAWPALAAPGDVAPGTITADALDIDGFLRVLDRWSALFGADHDGSLDPEALRRELPGDWEVATVDGPVAVPTGWLGEALADLSSHPESRPCVARAIHERLAALGREALALSTDPPGPAASEARPVLDRVLSRREFAGLGESSLLDALRSRILEWMREHLGWLVDAMRGHPVAGELIAWLVLAAALGTLGLWARRAWGGPSGVSAPRPSRALVPGAETIDAAGEARAAVGRGENRAAVRWAYAAALQSLAARDRLRSDKSWTHRELLRCVPEGDVCRLPFVELTRLFERTWYGSLRAEPDDARLALAELERLGCALSFPPATARS